MFYVAKKKATKKRRASSPRRSSGPFWADALIAIIYLLKSLLLLGSLGLLVGMAFSVDFALQVRESILKQLTDPEIAQNLRSLDQIKGIGLSIVFVGLLPILFLFVRGIWNARKFPFFLVLLLEASNVALMLMSTKNEARLGAVLPIIVAIYSLLRLIGAVGPKMK